MERLTRLGRRLGEALGLARASHRTLAAVGEMDGADGYRDLLARIQDEEARLAGRIDRSLDGLGSTATAVRDTAERVERLVADMRRASLPEGATAVDGLAFVAMLEGRELLHWEALQRLAGDVDDEQLAGLVDDAVPLQQRHHEAARQATIQLAGEEDPDEPA